MLQKNRLKLNETKAFSLPYKQVNFLFLFIAHYKQVVLGGGAFSY